MTGSFSVERCSVTASGPNRFINTPGSDECFQLLITIQEVSFHVCLTVV